MFRCGGDLGAGRLFSQWTAIYTVTAETAPQCEECALFGRAKIRSLLRIAAAQLLRCMSPVLAQSGQGMLHAEEPTDRSGFGHAQAPSPM
jgi:hypothetical protein